MLDPCVRLDPSSQASGQGGGRGTEGFMQRVRGGVEHRALLLVVGANDARAGVALCPLAQPV
eukprot:10851478-Lingulodinium_polyedra.AAC.1